MDSIIEAAKSSTLFGGMDNSTIKVLLNSLLPTVKNYEKGQIIVIEGDSVSQLGLIISGEASAVKINANGDALTAAVLTKGDVFGDMLAASANAKSPVTVKAETACSVAFIRHAALFETSDSSDTPRLLLLKNMLQIMSDKYFLQEQRVSVLAEKNLKNRIKRWLRYESRTQGSKTVKVPPRDTLAAMLGCDRTALCRVLGEMKKAHEIETDKKTIKITA